MRLLFIICEASVDQRIADLLDDLKAPGYTRFTGTIGHGPSGRREGTAVWPGLNSIVMTCVPDELIPEIVKGIEHIQADRSGRLAAKVIAVPAETYC